MAKIEVVVEYQDGMSLDPAATTLERTQFDSKDQAHRCLSTLMVHDKAALDAWLEIDGVVAF